jgi:cation transport regulator ChaB
MASLEETRSKNSRRDYSRNYLNLSFEQLLRAVDRREAGAAVELLERTGSWPSDDPEVRRAQKAAERLLNPGGRKPPSPGTLPKKGAKMLGAVYESAAESLKSRGIQGKSAKSRAARQAWCAVKRQYKKVGGAWSKRKRPLGQDEQPPGCTRLANIARRLKR